MPPSWMLDLYRIGAEAKWGWSLTAVKRKSMRNALVPGRRPRKFPEPVLPEKKKLNDSDLKFA